MVKNKRFRVVQRRVEFYEAFIWAKTREAAIVKFDELTKDGDEIVEFRPYQQGMSDYVEVCEVELAEEK